MSRIVKAKWVTQIQKTEEVDLDKKDAHEKARSLENNEKLNNDVGEDESEEITDAKGNEPEEEEVDHQLEAIKAANDFMKSALRSSRDIKEKSHEQGFNAGYNEGYELGHEVGMQKGMEEGKVLAVKEAQTTIQELVDLVELLNDERSQLMQHMEQEFLSVALEIARKIMRYEINKDEEAFIKMFNEVIHEDDTGVKVYLSEYQKTIDLHMDKAIIDRIKELSKKSKVVILKEDDRIVVETDNAVIDMSVPVQLEQIQQTIEEN